MRLIDADKLRFYFGAYYLRDPNELCFSQSFVLRMIDRMPTVRPQIIRCKDCVKREYCRTSIVWAVSPPDDWYCADAEPYKGEDE